jgi:hypothetical protein
MSSISKPVFLNFKPPACPVCGKPAYSRGGVHPQCAVSRADKARQPKAIPRKEKSVAPSPWKKTCPRCNRQVAARRFACDCGHTFERAAGS